MSLGVVTADRRLGSAGLVVEPTMLHPTPPRPICYKHTQATPPPHKPHPSSAASHSGGHVAGRRDKGSSLHLEQLFCPQCLLELREEVFVLGGVSQGLGCLGVGLGQVALPQGHDTAGERTLSLTHTHYTHLPMHDRKERSGILNQSQFM